MSAAIITSDKVVPMTPGAAATPVRAANEAAPVAPPVVAAAPREPRTPISEILLNIFKAVFPPIAGMVLLIAVWALLAGSGGSIPGPLPVWEAAKVLFADPFYNNGPNDMGIGWNVLSSLQRVGIGFGFAALVGIPLGFIIGRFAFMNAMLDPIISLLRPVSPLAWLPIGLLVFKSANPAAIWTIFICSIWPMLLNTAFGVASVRPVSVTWGDATAGGLATSAVAATIAAMTGMRGTAGARLYLAMGCSLRAVELGYPLAICQKQLHRRPRLLRILWLRWGFLAAVNRLWRKRWRKIWDAPCWRAMLFTPPPAKKKWHKARR